MIAFICHGVLDNVKKPLCFSNRSHPTSVLVFTDTHTNHRVTPRKQPRVAEMAARAAISLA